MKARAYLRAEAGVDGTRLTALRSAPPLSLRPTPSSLVLVGSAAGPLGGDDLHLELDIDDHAELTITTVAANLALPGSDGGPSRARVIARVGRGATLRWLPHPLIAATGCDHHLTAAIDLADDAHLEWRDELVLGRHAEPAGTCRTRLHADRGGTPLLRHELHTGLPDAHGPAGLAGARAVGNILLAGDHEATGPPAGVADSDEPRAAVLPLDGAGVLITAVADSAGELCRRLNAARHGFLTDATPAGI